MCKVREEPAPCLITAQGATGCDGVWQCVAVCGRPRSDKVFAPRSTVTTLFNSAVPAMPAKSRVEHVDGVECRACTWRRALSSLARDW